MNLTAECPCFLPPALLENVTEHPLEVELKNSSLLYQLRRRATHSRDAVEASIYIFGLTGLVVISVFMSKMWRTKSNLEAKRKIYFPQGPKDQLLVKDMLKKRAKSFMQYFKKTKKSRKSSNDNDDNVDYSTYLRMDTFFDSTSVDSNHTRFLESSSSSSEDEETSVLVWDKKKGDWIAYESDDDDNVDDNVNQNCVEYHFDQPENVCSEASEESNYDSDCPLIRV